MARTPAPSPPLPPPPLRPGVPAWHAELSRSQTAWIGCLSQVGLGPEGRGWSRRVGGEASIPGQGHLSALQGREETLHRGSTVS